MTVNIRGGLDVAVTKPLLHILERKTHAQQIAGRAVPQLMETNLRQPMLFEELLKLVRHVIRRERSAVTPAKHIVAFVIGVAEKLFVFLLLGLQLKQEFFYIRRHGEGAAAGIVLGLILRDNGCDSGYTRDYYTVKYDNPGYDYAFTY